MTGYQHLQASVKLVSRRHIPEASLVVVAVRGARQAKLQAGVDEALKAILASVNQHKDHVPPVTSSHALTFPFDITISG